MPQVLEISEISNEACTDATANGVYSTARTPHWRGGFWRSVLAIFRNSAPERTPEYTELLHERAGTLEHVRRRSFSFYERALSL